MDRLYCMQAFVRVVEHSSFTKAADALAIARASATEAVAQLEKHVGVRLLNRTTRRVTLTDEGRIFYASCVRILGEIAEAEEALSGTRLKPRGRLRVSVPQSFVGETFFPALKRFIDRYPDLEIEIVLTDRGVNLVEEGIDCAIRGLELAPDSGLVARTLSTTKWLTCASPEYFARFGTPGNIEELSDHNCIRFISQSTGRPRDWDFDVNGEIVRFVPKGTLRLTSFDAVIQMARSGSGIAQIPDDLGFESVMSGLLQPVLTEHVAAAPSLVLVYPGNRYLTAKVKAFVEHMSESFPKEGWWDRIVARLEAVRVAV